jgi:NADPH:quinone reductase-like Zn-dependent oxidoreductase
MSLTSLQDAAAASRPVATADTRLVGVPGAVAGLFPGGGMRKGSTVVIGPAAGGSSLAFCLLAAVTGGGGWAAAVGTPSLGLAAAEEIGVRLERLALVGRPGDQWPAVAAALLDGVDVLLLQPPTRVRPAEGSRLAARVRERGSVLVVLETGRAPWPESPDLRLSVVRSDWEGLGMGHGHLRARRVEVSSTGRRAAVRERRLFLWLPAPAGGVCECETAAPLAGTPVALVG